MKISEIIIDENIYPRKNVYIETISRYCELLKSGENLPPLVVMPDSRLLDGRHRYEAHMQAGKKESEVIIEDPEDPDARAVELNLRHGRPLTQGVCPVEKAQEVKKTKVTRMFVSPDGTVRAEHELTEEEKNRFAQKIMDVFLAPLAYEAVLRDLQREKESAH